ncbi:acyltransferase family protein [Pseudoflavitalea rhizosphaerae]|uniref:acyltransferase family protein n=1 Tax=Pseudoflavitalea rhizosphaerae TaxID=1884793 RepID=UPI000F8F33F9|nr:heparan-alpha-glucosaminide N-acetyltransferase domain-containing protein [Pseudoflavitalea rhizosphaerae]
MNQRFYSLDVFRGATVALMILVNNPGSWSHLYGPLAHAPWHGCTPTDLVFPFFLFAVGNAMAFVLPRLQAAGTPVFLKKVIKRSILIFAIGLFLNWSPFLKWSDGELVFKHWVDPNNPESGIRILGVLQRIAICYLFASLIVYFMKVRGAIIISAIILLLYWMLSLFLGAPGDPYSLNGYFGTQIDKNILGIAHMYKGEGVPFDPEGLTSTLPAIVQVILGFLVGNYIQQKGKTFEMLSGLFVYGCLLIFGGFAWDMAFPINKKIWTSSYVLYTTGLAIMVLSVLIYAIEFKGAKGAWSKFFDVFGKNALFVFALSGFLPKLLPLFRWVDHVDEKGNNVYTSAFPWFYQHICKPLTAFTDNPKNGSLLYALCMIAFYWLIVYWLDKKKIYIKV